MDSIIFFIPLLSVVVIEQIDNTSASKMKLPMIFSNVFKNFTLFVYFIINCNSLQYTVPILYYIIYCLSIINI